MQSTARAIRYCAISTELALLSDKRLGDVLFNAAAHNSGIGGATATIEILGTKVFVKRVPLTDLERLPENMLSTANLFELPLYFQYGIGSAGFSAWRELGAHTMTTNFVLSGECLNFPLMYHWRLIPSAASRAMTLEESQEIERSVEYWGGSPAIRARLTAKQSASVELVLFLEHVAWTLSKWLRERLSHDDQDARSAVIMIERDLATVTSFMNARGLLHFDAHFDNILTDGECLYFTDFGLAISNRFELSGEEADFFEHHRNYDHALGLASLVYWALPATVADEERTSLLQAFADGRGSARFGPTITAILNRHAPVARLMKAFMRALRTQSKTTPYPASDVARALST